MELPFVVHLHRGAVGGCHTCNLEFVYDAMVEVEMGDSRGYGSIFCLDRTSIGRLILRNQVDFVIAEIQNSHVEKLEGVR